MKCHPSAVEAATASLAADGRAKPAFVIRKRFGRGTIAFLLVGPAIAGPAPAIPERSRIHRRSRPAPAAPVAV